MLIEVVTVDFYLAGCDSLKLKRRALSGLRDRFGRIPHVAVVESDFQDIHKRSQWSFTVCALEQKMIDKTIAQIEKFVTSDIDAQLNSLYREKM